MKRQTKNDIFWITITLIVSHGIIFLCSVFYIILFFDDPRMQYQFQCDISKEDFLKKLDTLKNSHPELIDYSYMGTTEHDLIIEETSKYTLCKIHLNNSDEIVNLYITTAKENKTDISLLLRDCSPIIEFKIEQKFQKEILDKMNIDYKYRIFSLPVICHKFVVGTFFHIRELVLLYVLLIATELVIFRATENQISNSRTGI